MAAEIACPLVTLSASGGCLQRCRGGPGCEWFHDDVLLYESFETYYTHTRIGRLDTSDGSSEALGAGDVRATFCRAECGS